MRKFLISDPHFSAIIKTLDKLLKMYLVYQSTENSSKSKMARTKIMGPYHSTDSESG